MNICENAKKAMLSAAAKKSVASSVKSANTACIIWQYQPKESEKIKKLRKF